MESAKNITVCFTADQFIKFKDKLSTVVVVDLLRATSVISTAFEFGIKEVIPVLSIEEALSFKNKSNHIIAGERNTFKVEGFDYGNSPFHYMNADIVGKTLALTTTNGTKAIHIAKEHKVITASFVNLDAVVDYLINDNHDVIILCSGWKGLFNLEDSILAGALSERLISYNFESKCDSMYASINLYNSSKNNLFKYLKNSAYRKRNTTENVIRDTKFCLNPHIKSSIVPKFDNGRLIRS